jgi:mRNA interferase RelE/StbE
LDEYRIFETRQFRKDLDEISHGGRRDIERKLRETVYEELRHHPHFGPNIRKLKGYDPETWRYRIGAWRFFYETDESEKIVFLTAASHRGAAY